MSDHQLLEPSEALAELGRIKLADTNIDSVLAKIAELAQRALPGADEVSVTLIRDKSAYTAAYTGDLALACDERQYERGHGPCIDAARSNATLLIEDMDHETRWPDYTASAAEAGARSSLSIGLPVHEAVVGALNIYATKTDAFDDDAIVLAQTFGGYAEVVLANAYLYDTQARLAQQMQAAMENRAVIEQAKGIIMGKRHCNSDQAFQILAKLSQDTNRKLRDVAAALVTSAHQ